MGNSKLIGGFTPILKLKDDGVTTVYKAYESSLERFVLLKVLSGFDGDTDEPVMFFISEAKISAQIVHPNLVPVYRFGEEGSSFYLASAFIEGVDLDSFIRTTGNLPPEIACGIALQMFAGLDAAHKAKVVHRDFKPANIMLGFDGVVKVTDFGFASLISDVNDAQICGTPGYFAPEVISGQPPSVQSDLFAAGGVMFEMLDGRPAFKRESINETINALCTFNPMPVLERLYDFPTFLTDLVAQLIDKRASQRPESGESIIENLSRNVQDFWGKIPTSADLAVYLEDPTSWTNWAPKFDKIVNPPAEKSIVDPSAVSKLPETTEKAKLEPKHSQKIKKLLFKFIKPIKFITPILIVILAPMIWFYGFGSNVNHTAFSPPAIQTDSIPLIQVQNSATSPTEVAFGDQDESNLPDNNTADQQQAETPTDRNNNLQDNQPETNLISPTDDPITSQVDVVDSTAIILESQPGSFVENDKFYALTIACLPWCAVKINGQDYGNTPLDEKLMLPAGETYAVKLSHPDFPDATFDTTFTGKITDALNQDITLNHSFIKQIGEIEFTVIPWAEVWVDGSYIGTTPLENNLIINPGVHQLSFRHPELGIYTTKLQINPGELLEQRINMLKMATQQ